MSYKGRLTILHTAEINHLYGIPSLSLEVKRVSFALNDLEQDVIKTIRNRKHKCYAIAILSYFKIKPIQLNPPYKELQEDLAFIAEEYFPMFEVPRFSVSRMQKARIDDKVFSLHCSGLGFCARLLIKLQRSHTRQRPNKISAHQLRRCHAANGGGVTQKQGFDYR